MKWTKEEIDKCIQLTSEGKSFKDIGILLKRSHYSVDAKMKRLKIKSGYTGHGHNKGKTKYSEYDWDLIQSKHDDGFSYDDIISFFNISPQSIIWAKKNDKLIFRSVSDGLKLAWKKGKLKKSDKLGIERYRQLCSFKFNLSDYPSKFDFDLIKEHGWYKAKNRGDNPTGVSRDHILSVKEGYEKGILPYYLSHPANCQLMIHTENNIKNTNSDITIEELIQKIKEWDNDKILKERKNIF